MQNSTPDAHQFHTTRGPSPKLIYVRTWRPNARQYPGWQRHDLVGGF
jgi:hypothetical protein